MVPDLPPLPLHQTHDNSLITVDNSNMMAKSLITTVTVLPHNSYHCFMTTNYLIIIMNCDIPYMHQDVLHGYNCTKVWPRIPILCETEILL